MESKEKNIALCPHCDKEVYGEVDKCPFCGEFLFRETIASLLREIDQLDQTIEDDNSEIREELTRQLEHKRRESRVGLARHHDNVFSSERQKLWHTLFNSPMSEELTFSRTINIMILICNLIPPLFIISAVLIVSERMREVKYWVDTGERFQKSTFFIINNYFAWTWYVIASVLAIVAILHFVGYVQIPSIL